MATKKCPVCGVSVKLENLERHVKSQHPRAQVDLSTTLSQTEQRAAKAATTPARPKMSRGGKRIIVAIALILAVIMVLVIFNPFRGVGPNVGSTAPDFTAGACSGSTEIGTVTLSSYRGFPVVLEIMDVDCVYCQREASVLASVYQTYSPRGVKFLSVSLIDFVQEPTSGPDTCATIASFETQYAGGTTWQYALDNHPLRSVRAAYAVSGTPSTFLIDRDQIISKVFIGQAPGGFNSYRDVLDRLV